MVRSSASLVEEYRTTNERVSCLNRIVQVKWHPLDALRFKMNVDEGIHWLACHKFWDGDTRLAGTVLAAMSKRIPTTLAVLEAEVKSMETVVQFVWEMGFREVYFETNSLTLRNILRGTSEAPASIETVMDSILAQMEKFRFVSFTHVKRDGNRPAHILAQFAKQVGDFVVWLEETPFDWGSVFSGCISHFFWCFIRISVFQWKKKKGKKKHGKKKHLWKKS